MKDASAIVGRLPAQKTVEKQKVSPYSLKTQRSLEYPSTTLDYDLLKKSCSRIFPKNH